MFLQSKEWKVQIFSRVLLWSRASVSDAHVRLIKTAIKQPCNDSVSAGRVVNSRCSFSLSLCIPKWQQRT